MPPQRGSGGPPRQAPAEPPSPQRRRGRPPPPDEYEGNEEEPPPPPRPAKRQGAPQGAPRPAAGKQQRAPPPPPPPEEEEEEMYDEPPVIEEDKRNAIQKMSAAIDNMPPGPKMMYTMVTNSLALVLVTVIGGLVFSALEVPNQNSVQTEYAAFMSVLQTQLSMVPNGNATYATLIGNYMDDPTQMVDFWGPTTHTLYLFAFTIVTTIGYGSFAPKTAPGQIFCIVYILIAVPIGAVCLGKVAGTLLELMEWGAYCLNPRIHRARKAADKDGVGVFEYEDIRVAIGEVQSHDIDKKAFMSAVKELDPLEQHEFGIGKFTKLFLMVDTEEMQEARNGDRAKVCSLLVIGWLLLGTFVFKQSEGWTFVEGFYFCIVTLTTIGFGDYVPASTMGDNFHFIYCIIGLGLVATFLSSISAILAGGGGGDDEEEEPEEKAAPAEDGAEGMAEDEGYGEEEEEEPAQGGSQYGSRYGAGLPVMAMAARTSGGMGRGSGGSGVERYRPPAPAGAKASGERGAQAAAPQAPAATDSNPLNMVGNFLGTIPGLFVWPGQQPAAPVAREPSAKPPAPQQQPPPPRPRDAKGKGRMRPVPEDY